MRGPAATPPSDCWPLPCSCCLRPRQLVDCPVRNVTDPDGRKKRTCWASNHRWGCGWLCRHIHVCTAGRPSLQHALDVVYGIYRVYERGPRPALACQRASQQLVVMGPCGRTTHRAVSVSLACPLPAPIAERRAVPDASYASVSLACPLPAPIAERRCT